LISTTTTRRRRGRRRSLKVRVLQVSAEESKREKVTRELFKASTTQRCKKAK
jgi:hypothetical protein